MDRRNFIRLGLAGAGGTLVLPKMVLAECAPVMAGGMYHTAETPGRWNKKVASHLPNVETEKRPEGTAVMIHTRHEIEDYDHYIVKHMILDGDYRFIDERMFIPGKDKEARSEFVLDGYSGPLFALSVCNKHDTWLNTAEI